MIMPTNLFLRWLKKTFDIQASQAGNHRGNRRHPPSGRCHLFLEELENRNLFSANPLVQSINLANPAGPLTGATSIAYTVTFSEPVTGVATKDFQLAETGTVTAAVTQVTPVNGCVYTVTVSGIKGNGTLGLNLVDDGSIRDLAGHNLVGFTSFQNPQTFATGLRPWFVTAADVNGDGKTDLVTADSNFFHEGQSSVSVLLGNGDGTFQGRIANAPDPGDVPLSVAVADLNGDGKPDLVVSNQDYVIVMLGNGDGTFQNQQPFAVGPASHYSVAVADLNGDGKPDLVVTNNGNTVSVLLGNGDGTFKNPTTLSVGPGVPYSVALADVNGDGKTDIVTANRSGNNVSVLLGNGDGTFQNPQTFAAGQAPWSVAVADVNGDNRPDLVVANEGSDSVSVLLGNGDGTFQNQQTFTTNQPLYASEEPTSVAVADINGDGKADLIVADHGNNTVSVLPGNGDGTFQNPIHFATGGQPRKLAVADFNGDGKPDLVTSNFDDNSVSVLLNTSNGDFTGQVYTIDQVPPVVLAITPTTPAGPGDLVTSASSVSYSVTFSKPVTGVDATDFTLSGTGNVATTSIQTAADPNDPNPSLPTTWIVTISGITGNGTLGLQMANSNHIFDIAGNALSLAATPVTLQSLPTITLPAGESVMAVADIDGDGKGDLIIANSLTNSMSVMLGNGDGTFQNQQPFAVGVAPFKGVVADVNGDGKPDLVMVNAGTDTVSVLLNNGNGTFQSPKTYLSSNDGTAAVAVTVADINGDGKPDLVVANSGGNYNNGNVSVLLNNGNGTFQVPQTLVNSSPFVHPFDPNSLAVGDVNGDGKLDILVGTKDLGNYYGPSAAPTILLNDGQGNFTSTQPFWGNSAPALADLNGDGKSDFIDGNALVTFQLSNGDGTFSDPVVLPNLKAVGYVPFGADLTGTGKLEDLVVSMPGANTVNVFLSVPPVYTIDTPTAHIAANLNVTQAPDQANLVLSATDPQGSQELAAGFTYAINWGDGTTQQTISPTANNGSGVSVSHTFAADGSYLVSVTAANKDGAVSSAATSLVVVSSHAGDGIALSGGASTGQVAVSVNAATASTFSPTDLVLVSGQGGGDTYTVNFGSNLTTPVVLAGGGSDSVIANGSNGDNYIAKHTGGTSTISWGPQASPTAVQALETVTYTGAPAVTINPGTNPGNQQKNYIVDPGSNTTINGGPGQNTIVITATTGNGVVINGGSGTNNYVIDLGSLAGPVTINNSNAAAGNRLTVNGAAGNNTITVAGNQVTSGTQTITETAPLSNLTVNGGSGNNQLTVSTVTVPVQNLALNGGGGNNTFTLNNVGSNVAGVAITPGSGGPGSNQVQVQGSLPAAANPVPVVGSLGGPASAIPGQAVTLTAPYSVSGPASTEAVTWNWGDATTTTQTVSSSSGTLSASHVYAAASPTSYGVTLTMTDNTDGLATQANFGVTVTQSIYALNGTAAGSVSVSGNAGISIPGTLYVDSSSRTALTESGNAHVSAAAIQVVGGVSKSGNATLSPAAATGAASVADPLASLTGPSTSGLTNYSAARYSNGAHTLCPGIYSQISASGNASLTLNPGLYLIEGGGFTVTGNASVSGTGVTIYNTSSNYPSSTGSYGGITLSGNGTFSLTAPTSGLYPGIVIFQPRANTRAVSLSGSAAAGLAGTVYAPGALVYLSGNATVNGALVVNELSLSGNAASTQVADGGDVNGGSAAGQLLAGNLEVYVNDPNNLFTTDELARIQDAVTAADAVVEPYGVSVSETTDPTVANVTIDTGSTSAVGGQADGILGCWNPAGSEITLVQGWNWYAGSDPTQIGATQYDFQTTLTHELGHALGLGESDDPTSAMSGTLATGTVIRTLTTADLHIPPEETGADAQRAAPLPIPPAEGPSNVPPASSPSPDVFFALLADQAVGSAPNLPRGYQLPAIDADGANFLGKGLSERGLPDSAANSGVRNDTPVYVSLSAETDAEPLAGKSLFPDAPEDSGTSLPTFAVARLARGSQPVGADVPSGGIGRVAALSPAPSASASPSLSYGREQAGQPTARAALPSAAALDDFFQGLGRWASELIGSGPDAGQGDSPVTREMSAEGALLFALLGTTWAVRAEEPETQKPRRPWRG
jgi:hypothetical protein